MWRPYLETGYRVFLEVLLGFGPVEQSLYRLGIVVDSGRGGRLVGAPLPLWPAVLLSSHVVYEVTDVIPGDLLQFGPAILPGEPVQF